LPAIEEARSNLAKSGLSSDFLRIRALPINDDTRDFVANHKRIYVIELNRDGQLHQVLTVEMPEMASRLMSLTRIDGFPATARWIINSIQANEPVGN
jgi:2-oxoglutarate ferredoxin oxidoreductase subunit alpha